MSLRAPIDRMCKACIHDPHGGGGSWRAQVTACTAPSCPLFPVRPLAQGVDRDLASTTILRLENGQFRPVSECAA